MPKQKKRKLYSGQLPFDKNGMPTYPEEYPGHQVTWRDNIPFQATLTFDTYSRGRSAAHFHFKDSKGCSFPMFLTDFSDLIRAKVLDKGTVTGTWAGVKRGANYGLMLWEEKD